MSDRDVADLPLDGVRVAHFGVGMAAALVARFLAQAGATVHRMAARGGDPFDDVYPAYPAWRAALAGDEIWSAEGERALLEKADICIVGGEDFVGLTPRRDGAAMSSRYPSLIVLEIAPQLASEGDDPLHGADILVQARTGLVFEPYADRPALLGFVPSAYGAALHGLIAVGAALCRRVATGRGQLVRAGLLEGALAWPLAFWTRSERPTERSSFRAPRGARALIFRTRDGKYLQLVLGSIGSKYNMYKVLGMDDPSIKPTDAGLPNPADGPDRYFGDVDLLAPRVATWDAAPLMAAFAERGVVCEEVLGGAACWDDPQVRENGIIDCGTDGIEQVGMPVQWSFSAAAQTPPAPSSGDAPLSGIKVVDFGAFVAGPTLSVGLADLGAEVIKVEPPRGDPMRAIYSFYAAANRGKRSIAIEMKEAEGLEIAHRIARGADVVSSNFRNGVAERLGIGATMLHAAKPDMIVALNPGYGTSGPRANAPAFDPCMQARCGLEVRAGGQGRAPALNPMMMTDLCGGLLGEIGVLFALYRRAQSGSGATVTVPLLNAGLFLMSDIVRTAGGEILGPTTLLPDQTGYHVAEKLYQADDGWIAISARGQMAANALGRALGLPGLGRKDWRQWGDAEMRAIASAIASGSVQDAVAKLRSEGVPAEPCRPHAPQAMLASEDAVCAGRVYEADRPEIGLTRGIGRLFEMSDQLGTPNGRVSGIGEDGGAILLELGFCDAEIQALATRGTVKLPQ